MTTTRTRRPNITGDDLMDTDEVAEAFGVAHKSVNTAMSHPHVFPTLAVRLPAPLRKVGKGWVWLRYDIEKAVKQ